MARRTKRRTTPFAKGYKGGGWGRWWTANEVEKVRKWQEQGVPGEEQARRLGRSYASWKSALRRYGLHNDEPHTNFNPDLRLFIIERLIAGAKQADVMRERGLKSHTHIGRIVRDLIRRRVLVRVNRVRYAAGPEWGGVREA